MLIYEDLDTYVEATVGVAQLYLEVEDDLAGYDIIDSISKHGEEPNLVVRFHVRSLNAAARVVGRLEHLGSNTDFKVVTVWNPESFR